MSAPDPLPFELTRCGFTFGTDREISDDDVVAMFIVDGEVAPKLWVDQDFPAIGDLFLATAIGVDGDLLVVRARIWQTPNLVMIGCAHHEADDHPRMESDADADG